MTSQNEFLLTVNPDHCSKNMGSVMLQEHSQSTQEQLRALNMMMYFFQLLKQVRAEAVTALQNKAY